LPAPKYYYRYGYGNADFFVVDTNRPVRSNSDQYKWLDRELAASTAKWKFVYHHHPAYSSDDNDYGDTWTGSSTLGDMKVRPLAALYEKHHVDVAFNGHIHLYERSWPIRAGKVDSNAGVVYVTSGGGGGKLENFGPTPAFFKAELRVDHHYCYVTIHGGILNFKAFDHNGMLFDSFELRK
jgi:acid phosphatase type 7